MNYKTNQKGQTFLKEIIIFLGKCLKNINKKMKNLCRLLNKQNRNHSVS